MRSLLLVASVAVLAAATVNCGSPSTTDILSPAAPTATSSNLVVTSAGKGNSKVPPPPVQQAFMVSMVTDNNANELPDWGDSVSFEVLTTETWSQINLTCYQGELPVLTATWPTTPVVVLQSASWSSGSAQCTANLMGPKTRKPIETVNFTVGA